MVVQPLFSVSPYILLYNVKKLFFDEIFLKNVIQTFEKFQRKEVEILAVTVELFYPSICHKIFTKYVTRENSRIASACNGVCPHARVVTIKIPKTL